MFKYVLMIVVSSASLWGMEEGRDFSNGIEKKQRIIKSAKEIRKERIVRAKVIAARVLLISLAHLGIYWLRGWKYDKDLKNFEYDLRNNMHENPILREDGSYDTREIHLNTELRPLLPQEIQGKMNIYRQTHIKPALDLNWRISWLLLAGAALIFPLTSFEKKYFS